MMMRRRRPLMRAGMLAGTAYAAHRAGQHSTEREYAESEQDQRLAELERQQYQAPMAPPPAAPMAAAPAAAAQSDLVTELTKLKGLADAGVLTPAEFEAAKAKLLSTG